jgi:hypothetical protein
MTNSSSEFMKNSLNLASSALSVFTNASRGPVSCRLCGGDFTAPSAGDPSLLFASSGMSLRTFFRVL